MAGVPGDINVDKMGLDSNGKSKPKPKPKAKPKAKKGTSKDACDGDARATITNASQATPTKRDQSPGDENSADHGKQGQGQPSMESQSVMSPPKANGSQASEAKTPEGLEHFSSLVSGCASQPSQGLAPPKGETLGNKRRR